MTTVATEQPKPTKKPRAASTTPKAAEAPAAPPVTAVKKTKGTTAEAKDTSPQPKKELKRDILVAMLKMPSGASIAELTERLGWLPHTVRAAITGLRKAGHTIERKAADGGVTIYRIVAKA